jgi:hypothetical protein
MTSREIRELAFGKPGNTLQLQELSLSHLGQSCPQHCPQPVEYGSDPLGTPLTIREVARVIGCSAWTVRQRYVPQGLPHLRSGPQGKLIFYRDQVIRWIVNRQTKGGITK